MCTHYVLHYIILLYCLPRTLYIFCTIAVLFIALLIPPLLALFWRRRLPSIFYRLFDVLLFSNVALGTHGRNIGPCGTVCRVLLGALAFWVCRKWNNKEWWGWFVLLVYPRFEDFEEPAPDLELLL